MGRRRATCTAVLTVGLATVLAACSGADDVLQVRATDPPSSATSSVVPPAATTTRTGSGATSPAGSATGSATGSLPATSAPAAAGTAAGTGTPTSAAPARSTSTRTTATAKPPATATATRAATPAAATWPKPLGEPQQGQPAWAVYLAIGHGSTDPVVEKAVRQAAGVHYSAVVGDMACDVGAMEALHLDQFDLWSGATVYFRSQADARAFAASYGQAVAKPKGIVKVKVGCLD